MSSVGYAQVRAMLAGQLARDDSRKPSSGRLACSRDASARGSTTRKSRGFGPRRLVSSWFVAARAFTVATANADRNLVYFGRDRASARRASEEYSRILSEPDDAIAKGSAKDTRFLESEAGVEKLHQRWLAQTAARHPRHPPRARSTRAMRASLAA